MKLMRMVMSVLVFVVSITSAEMDIGGYVDTYQSIGLKGNRDLMGSRTRLRLEGDFYYGDAWAFASVNAVYNGIVVQETGVNLREAFIAYATNSFDFKAGNQIIIWGRSDGLYVTDNVSPKDYSEALARNFDDMRIPVTALRARMLLDKFTCELVWLPVFTPAIYPYRQEGVPGKWDDNPWAISFPAGVYINEAKTPEKKLENSEIGVKFSFSASAFDMSVSALYTWADIPALHPQRDGLQLLYHRLNIYGFDISVPVGMLVIRGEAAFTEGAHCLSESRLSLKKNTLTGLAGVDISPGNEWNITAQLYDRFILEYDSDFKEPQHDTYITVNISKKLFRNNFTVSAITFYGLEYREIYCRASAELVLTDAVSVGAGIDLFDGENEGSFGMYSENTAGFFECTYNF